MNYLSLTTYLSNTKGQNRFKHTGLNIRFFSSQPILHYYHEHSSSRNKAVTISTNNHNSLEIWLTNMIKSTFFSLSNLNQKIKSPRLENQIKQEEKQIANNQTKASLLIIIKPKSQNINQALSNLTRIKTENRQKEEEKESPEPESLMS